MFVNDTAAVVVKLENGLIISIQISIEYIRPHGDFFTFREYTKQLICVSAKSSHRDKPY